MNFVRRLFSYVKLSKRPWWVKNETQAPTCLYYFGPFDSEQEAEELQSGYIEDLVCEGAQNIETVIKEENPKILTVCEV